MKAIISLLLLQSSLPQTTTIAVRSSINLEPMATDCTENRTITHTGCACKKPWIGSKCEEKDCVSGLLAVHQNCDSSSYLIQYCLCDGWSGDFCEDKIDQCNGHGKEIQSKCHCYQFYTGNYCNFVTKCVNGQHTNGRCTCHNGWTGDFCDQTCTQFLSYASIPAIFLLQILAVIIIVIVITMCIYRCRCPLQLTRLNYVHVAEETPPTRVNCDVVNW